MKDNKEENLSNAKRAGKRKRTLGRIDAKDIFGITKRAKDFNEREYSAEGKPFYVQLRTMQFFTFL